MTLIIAKFYVLLFLCGTIWAKRIKVSKKQNISFIVLLVLALSTIAFYSIQPNTSDQYRHFLELNKIRSYNMSLIEFIYEGSRELGENYLYAFNLLRYVITELTENDHFLSMIFVSIDYAIISYIMYDWSKKNGGKGRIYTYPMLFCFSFLPYTYTVSTLRSPLAMCLTALGIYLYLYREKSKLCYLILLAIAATIHPCALFTVPFVFLANYRMKIWVYIIIIAGYRNLPTVAVWMRNRNTLFLQMLGKKFLDYTSESRFLLNRGLEYGILSLIAVIVFMFLLSYKRINNDEKFIKKRKIYNFCELFMIFILCNIHMFDLVIRNAHICGVLSPVICTMLTDSILNTEVKLNIRWQQLLKVGVWTACILLCVYLNYKNIALFGDRY